jgi:hypothetical protein
MAGNLSDVAEALVRKWLFSDSSATRPTQWFLALFTATPSDAGGGTEVGGSKGYARQEISFDSDGAANDAEIVFGPATADWGTVTHGAIFDETGRFLAWAAVGTARSIPNGDSARFPIGTITTSFD